MLFFAKNEFVGLYGVKTRKLIANEVHLFSNRPKLNFSGALDCGTLDFTTMTIDYDHDRFYSVRKLTGFSLGKWIAMVKPLSSTINVQWSWSSSQVIVPLSRVEYAN